LAKSKHILVLPEWYPNETDPQLGVFIEKHVRTIANDFKITVIYVHGNPLQKESIKLIDETTSFRLIRVTYKSSRFRLNNLIRYRRAFKLALQKIEQPDLIHLQVVGKNAIMRREFFPRVPFVITEHWSGYLRGEKKLLAPEPIVRKAFQDAQKVSAVSPFLATALTQKFGIQNIRLLPNLIEREEFLQEKNDTAFVFLSVADLDDRIKNISGVLRAFENIHTTQNIIYRIVGDGKDKSALMQLAGQLKFGENIKIEFTGRLSNPDALKEIRKANALIVNSRMETFGMVAAESIFAGVPVICTKCGGPEMFVDKTNGILIPKDDPEELIRAIEKMCHEASSFSSAEMSDSISKRFGKDTVREALLDLYGE
jgi:glycosyltransferase involved in cell wall biosynthesis